MNVYDGSVLKWVLIRWTLSTVLALNMYNMSTNVCYSTENNVPFLVNVIIQYKEKVFHVLN
jgi:hypothetical protein